MDDTVADAKTLPGPKPRKLRLWVVLTIIFSLVVGAVATIGGIAYWRIQAGTPPAIVKQSAAGPAATTSVPEKSVDPVTVRQVGDWAVVCPAVSAQTKDCFIQQQLRTRDQKIVLVWTIRADAGGVHAVWEVPADIIRERGLIVDLGDGKPKGVPFTACTDKTCTAKALLAPDFIRSIEAATKIVAAVSAPGKDSPIGFGLSSKGFADALGQLSGTPTAPGH